MLPAIRVGSRFIFVEHITDIDLNYMGDDIIAIWTARDPIALPCVCVKHGGPVATQIMAWLSNFEATRHLIDPSEFVADV